MDTKLLRAKGQEIATGQHPALPNQSVPLWARGSNMVFEDAAIKVAPGMQQLFIKSAADPVYGLLALETDDAEPALVWGTSEQLFYGGPPIVGSPPGVGSVGSGYGVNFAGRWTLAQFGTSLYAAHEGNEQVQRANVLGAAFQDISVAGGDAQAIALRPKILHPTDSFLIAMNTEGASYEIKWCDEDDPLTWIPTGTNKARDIQVRSLLSGIVAAVDFAQFIAVWGQSQCHLLRFTGAPFFFGAEHLISGPGPVGKDAVITVGRKMYGFGPNGIWVTDGVTFQYISQPSVHDYIYGKDGVYDESRGEHVCCWYDKDHSTVYFSYPTMDGGGETLGFKTTDGSWSMHAYWRTSGSDGQIWNVPVTADIVGNIWGQGLTGSPVSSIPEPIKVWEEVLGYDGGYGYFGYGELGYGGSTAFVEDDTETIWVYQGTVTAILTLSSGEQINLGLALDATGCFIETKALDFGDEALVKHIDRIFSNISDRGDQTALSLEIWGADDENGPFTQLDSQVLASKDPMSTLAPGQRFFKLVWKDQATLDRWRLHGFTIFGDPGGDEF